MLMDRSSYQSKEDVEPSVHFSSSWGLVMQLMQSYAGVVEGWYTVTTPSSKSPSHHPSVAAEVSLPHLES
jgi:hypothetical protein